VADAELSQVGLDHSEHGLQRGGAHDGEPLRFRHGEEILAVLIGKLLPDRFQIVAGIESFGDRADLLAERLAVAQEHGARQRIDLSAGVVDVIFARDGEAGEGEDMGVRLAKLFMAEGAVDYLASYK